MYTSLVMMFWHPWQIYLQIWLISADKVVKCRYIMYRQRCRYMKILPICYRQILSADSYIGRTLPHISIWFEWVVNLHILFPALSEQRAWHQQAPSSKSTIQFVYFSNSLLLASEVWIIPSQWMMIGHTLSFFIRDLCNF